MAGPVERQAAGPRPALVRSLWESQFFERPAMPITPAAASSFPDLTWPKVGDGRLDPNEGGGWRALIVYRGRHCPLCRKYLNQLQSMQDDFADAGIRVMALSADPVERASEEAEEEGWTFPIGCDLKPEDMLQLGLYVSTPRSPEETDRPFAEPGLFVINPNGRLQIIDVSNAPFARPDLKELLNGLKFIQEKNYPVRGTS